MTKAVEDRNFPTKDKIIEISEKIKDLLKGDIEDIFCAELSLFLNQDNKQINIDNLIDELAIAPEDKEKFILKIKNGELNKLERLTIFQTALNYIIKGDGNTLGTYDGETWKNPSNPLNHLLRSLVANRTYIHCLNGTNEQAELSSKLGLLHDLARLCGINDFSHTGASYKLLQSAGLPEEISLIGITHSFTISPEDSYKLFENIEKSNLDDEVIKSLQLKADLSCSFEIISDEELAEDNDTKTRLENEFYGINQLIANIVDWQADTHSDMSIFERMEGIIRRRTKADGDVTLAKILDDPNNKEYAKTVKKLLIVANNLLLTFLKINGREIEGYSYDNLVINPEENNSVDSIIEKFTIIENAWIALYKEQCNQTMQELNSQLNVKKKLLSLNNNTEIFKLLDIDKNSEIFTFICSNPELVNRILEYSDLYNSPKKENDSEYEEEVRRFANLGRWIREEIQILYDNNSKDSLNSKTL